VENMNEVRAAVEQNGDVKTFSMEVLRDAHGAGKLGVHVRAGISKALRGVGLAHSPDPLPIYQENLVRVYKQGTAVADLIEAATTPGEGRDEELRQAVGGDASDTLAKIKELVCK
jgi:hypothetical protein